MLFPFLGSKLTEIDIAGESDSKENQRIDEKRKKCRTEKISEACLFDKLNNYGYKKSCNRKNEKT